jgi:ABC-type branched-subunit amino acid transport system ATPase component
MHQGTDLVSGSPAEVRANPLVLDAYLGGGDGESTPEADHG